jgi:hypothetical protein
MHASDHTLRCDHCGDVIGVYEPLIVVSGDLARESSVAAEPALALGGGVNRHVACHAAQRGTHPAPLPPA